LRPKSPYTPLHNSWTRPPWNSASRTDPLRATQSTLSPLPHVRLPFRTRRPYHSSPFSSLPLKNWPQFSLSPFQCLPVSTLHGFFPPFPISLLFFSFLPPPRKKISLTFSLFPLPQYYGTFSTPHPSSSAPICFPVIRPLPFAVPPFRRRYPPTPRSLEPGTHILFSDNRRTRWREWNFFQFSKKTIMLPFSSICPKPPSLFFFLPIFSVGLNDGLISKRFRFFLLFRQP